MRHNEYDEVEEFDEVEDVEEDLAFSLTDQFYIRRNGKVKGPMDAKLIRKLVNSKKLKPSDEVSLSVDGSWDRLSKVYKDIISGTYVDGAAAKLPPRKSNRKKKVAKPLDGVKWLGSEGQIARMAMYQKYRTTLHITAGVVLFIIVVGVPTAWMAGTNFWGVVYENKPSVSSNPATDEANGQVQANDLAKQFAGTHELISFSEIFPDGSREKVVWTIDFYYLPDKLGHGICFKNVIKYRLPQGKDLLTNDPQIEVVFSGKDPNWKKTEAIIRSCMEGDTKTFNTWEIQSVTKKGQGFDLRLRVTFPLLGDKGHDVYELKGFTGVRLESCNGTLIQHMAVSRLKKSEWRYLGDAFDLQGALAEKIAAKKK